MSDHGWQSILRTDAAPRARLRGAIFTTYDRPDERLLVEHLLPELLRLDRSAEGDESERKLFFADLVRRLEELQRRLVIVSSMPESDDGGSRAYPWLWRFVHSLHVGRTGAATQHAKLWLLHCKRPAIPP